MPRKPTLVPKHVTSMAWMRDWCSRLDQTARTRRYLRVNGFSKHHAVQVSVSDKAVCRMLGVLRGMLKNEWRWTATESPHFAPFPQMTGAKSESPGFGTEQDAIQTRPTMGLPDRGKPAGVAVEVTPARQTEKHLFAHIDVQGGGSREGQ